MANWADSFAAMWKILWNELIYKVLAIFGITQGEDGNLDYTAPEAAE